MSDPSLHLAAPRGRVRLVLFRLCHALRLFARAARRWRAAGRGRGLVRRRDRRRALRGGARHRAVGGCVHAPRYVRAYFREWRMPLRALGTLLGWRGMPAVLEGLHLRCLLRELIGERRIEDCTTARMHLAVTNFRTSRVELRGHGPLVDTILASCALPGLIVPCRVEGEMLWDGGLGCSAPVEQWIDDPHVTHIVAHSILHDVQVRAREGTTATTSPAPY